MIEYLCHNPAAAGLKWNHKLASMIDPEDVRRIDIILSSYEDAQMGEQDFLRELLWQEHDFNYEHLYVFFDFRAQYGFEIACNLLMDDGNESKDIRRVLLSSKLSSIFSVHV